mgnify:CR=1 FL=1
MSDNIVYGKYSMGSGSILSDHNLVYSSLDNEEVIQQYEKSVRMDIEKSGIPLAKIKNFNIMDVGTGRQAVAFYQIGAKRVHHYDISLDNVKTMNTYIERNSLHDRINSDFADLVKYKLPNEKFDLVYLNGVVQHFSHVGIGLANCMNSIKRGGVFMALFLPLRHFPQICGLSYT